MRNFISSMLGALAAMILFCVAGSALFIVLLIVISSMGEKHVSVEPGSYLVVDLSTNITDAPPVLDFGMLTGDAVEVIQLRNATKAIRSAAKDSRIDGVLITGSLRPDGLGSGYAALAEMREALSDFKTSGKPIHAYLTYASTRDYYLASVAGDVALNPFGVIIMPGLATEPVFFANAFERFGIGVQVTRVGKYKSAVEPFIRDDLSAENRLQLQSLLNDIWTGLISDVAASRDLTVAAIQGVVDAEGLIRADKAKDAGLIDRIIYQDEILDELKLATGRNGTELPFKQISLREYAAVAPDPGGYGTGRIAVVYAEGDIVDGEGEWTQVGGDRFARELRKLRQDDKVKAIVLRVNSPGGSATASEVIQREMRLAAMEKPVVVSMGSYAASGGYWVSTYSDRIFAEPTTITGSIGVFGIVFDVKELAGNIGINFDSVKTGRFADALSISRPKTDAELAVLQRSIDWIYEQFIEKVAESRHLDRSVVEEIAQGRVWSGSEALKLGLVDELGSLNAAIRYAAEQADLGGGYRVTEFPRRKELGEAIAELFQRLQPAGARSGIYSDLLRRMEMELKTLNAYNDPQGIYARLPINLTFR
jgi:protease IV|uniref:signal peptide peptidase SppA n=1 Tax=Cephaloticoccus sp. TaxID=1985742 RepID=UPI00404B5D71